MAQAQVPTHYRYDNGDPRILRNLIDVGPTKALGYLSFDVIRAHGHDPYALASTLRASDRESLLLEPGESRFPAGALYVYHVATLGKLLDAHRRVLLKACWPTQPLLFVRRVADESVSQSRQPELYQLIGLAFADYRFAPRGPVMT